MKQKKVILAAVTLFCIVSILCLAQDKSNKLVEIEKILKNKGQMDEGVLVVKFPRTDLNVTINGESIPTSYGLVSWTAWKEHKNGIMVMGDLTLLEEEVNPVITVLVEAGIEITALHNHFFYANPHIIYMHINGMGDFKKLSEGVRLAIEKTKTKGIVSGSNQAEPMPLTVNTKKIEEIIGHKGIMGGGSFKITIGRSKVKMDGLIITSSMGLNSWVSFIGSDDKAHVAGDIVMTAAEVNQVIKVLNNGGIDIVAVHNHMLNEQPRVFYLHYWGTGTAFRLAITIRKAFDLVSGPIR